MWDTKLIVGNSTTQIITDSMTLRNVKEHLSYIDKQAMYALKKYSKGKSKKAVYISLLETSGNYSYFPTGLIDKVKNLLELKEHNVEIEDNRVPPDDKYIYIKKNTNTFKLRYYQTEIVEKCLETPRGVIEACTGAGKSLIAMELVYQRKLPTLIIVPSINIANQMYKGFIKYFNEKLVGMCGDGKNQIKKPIVIATYQSLINQKKEFFEQFQQLVVDESHHAGALTIQDINRLFLNHIYYRYYFSATPYRNDGADMALEGVIGTNFIYRYGFKKGLADGVIVKPTFQIHHYQHSIKDLKVLKDYQKEYKALIIEDDNYNNYIAEITEELATQGRKVIVFVKYVNHGKKLAKLIPGSVLMTGEEDSATNEKVLSAFEDGKIKILIGTSVIGEGVDIRSVDAGVLACGGKSKGDIVQKIGRLLRTHPGKNNCVFVDFTHAGSSFNKRHAQTRFNIYREEYGDELVKII